MNNYGQNHDYTAYTAASAGLNPASQAAVHVEYVTNPYGRPAPHILVFQDGRVEEMTALLAVAGEVRIDLLGTPSQPPTPTQLEALRQFTSRLKANGYHNFKGHTHLLQIDTPPAPATPIRFRMSKVDDIFDLLEVPADRRQPLKSGTILTAAVATMPNGMIRPLVAFPLTREVTTLVVVPSHDPFKPEPTDAGAYSLATLRQLDQRNGLPDFRAHYLIARSGELVAGRDLEQLGSAVPGYATGAVQVVLAGNGRSPTPEQRRMLMEFGALARKHYAPQSLKVVTRDVVFAKELLGVDGTGVMNEEYVRPEAVTAEIPVPKQSRR